MTDKESMFANLGRDVPASIVVALVALPLCLGIALASGAPLFSGLISGIVGGIVVGVISKSQLSVSGPAAGLTVIVLGALATLPSWEAFLLATMLAGLMQMALYFTRSGTLSEFVPSSVITGMLAAIGLILILKQIPHALGYDGDYEGSLSFLQPDGLNTITTLFYSVWDYLLFGPMIIAAISVWFLFFWDAKKPKEGPFRLLPGPLVVVLFGVLANEGFKLFAPSLVIEASHLVQVPVAESIDDFLSNFSTPDFSLIGLSDVWVVAATLAIVASLESLLCVKAIDEIDPRRRTSDKNHELLAQGGGNFVAGLIGGLPLTSVIVRSSANVSAGGVTKMSAILHGLWLLASVVTIPMLLNLIPLSALAAILIHTGYKLTTPQLFVRRWKQGWHQFVPFFATVAAILLTDLLMGIVIGMVIGFVFVVARNFRTAITVANDGEFYLVKSRRNLYFIHKYELQQSLQMIPAGATVVIDLDRSEFVDPDNIEIINSFVKNAQYKDIEVSVRHDLEHLEGSGLRAPLRKVAYS